MGMHDGHRNRLRESFLATGLAGKTEHQALELLLTYAIPRIDVNPIAHELIDRFGSLAGVIDAEAETLMRVGHISQNSAVLLKLIPQIAQMYSECKWKERRLLKSVPQVEEYLRPKMEHEKNEVFYLLALDNHCRLIEAIRMSEGTPNQSQVSVRNVVDDSLRVGATQVILAHNHPSGIAEPSPADIQVTRFLFSALAPLGVTVLDHIIIAGNQSFSLRSHGLFAPGE